jgi:hypothetical protein
MGRLLIIAGIVIVAIGLALEFAPWLVNWFGQLPGDINYRSGNTQIFIPIVSMLLISIMLSLVLWLIQR